MMGVYPIEPKDGWHAGDRAYCVRGTRESIPAVVTGKVYEVETVIAVPNHVGCGLALLGIETPGVRGFWSHRFVKIDKGAGALRQIDRACARTWIDAYYANTGRKNVEAA